MSANSIIKLTDDEQHQDQQIAFALEDVIVETQIDSQRPTTPCVGHR